MSCISPLIRSELGLPGAVGDRRAGSPEVPFAFPQQPPGRPATHDDRAARGRSVQQDRDDEDPPGQDQRERPQRRSVETSRACSTWLKE